MIAIYQSEEKEPSSHHNQNLEPIRKVIGEFKQLLWSKCIITELLDKHSGERIGVLCHYSR